MTDLNDDPVLAVVQKVSLSIVGFVFGVALMCGAAWCAGKLYWKLRRRRQRGRENRERNGGSA